MFNTELFERYERSEKPFVSALMQMQVHRVSIRKVAKVTVALCGHDFSASAAGRINAKLDADLKNFAERPLKDPFLYLIWMSVTRRFARMASFAKARSISGTSAST